MMSRMLGMHDDIYSFSELHVLDTKIGAGELKNGIDRKAALSLVGRIISIERNGFYSSVSPEIYISEAEKVLGDVADESGDRYSAMSVFYQALVSYARCSNKRIPCEQTPKNIFYIDEILHSYPDAKIIYMFRDPRDVMLSQKNRWKRRYLGGSSIPLLETVRAWANYHPFTISKIWSANEKIARRICEDSRVMQVSFEGLLADPGSVLNAVCSHIGVAYSEAMLDVPVVGSSMGADNPSKKGVDSSRLGSWRRGGLNAAELHICQSYCGDFMKLRGYQLEQIRPEILLLAVTWFLLPLKLLLAVFFNIHRSANLMDSFKRRFLAR